MENLMLYPKFSSTRKLLEIIFELESNSPAWVKAAFEIDWATRGQDISKVIYEQCHSPGTSLSLELFA